MFNKGIFYNGICLIVIITLLLMLSGCVSKIKLVTDSRDPLQEFNIEGDGDGKVAIIPIVGFISDIPKVSMSSMIRHKSSLVQEIVSQMRLAEEDDDVKAVLFQINSPGGTSTGSDVLYHEILEFKKRTGKKVVVTMMDIATSGGYYVALPADYIFAHPTTVTGSVGAIFVRPKIVGLMDKIGVDVKVSKSGKDKDMGAFYIPATEGENKLFDDLIGEMGKIFINLVKKHRRLNASQLKNVSTAKVFLAPQALKVGLIDEIGYVNDAIDKTKALADLDKDAEVIVYRRSYYPNDNIYNVSNNSFQNCKLIDLGIFSDLASLQPGFYYLWAPAIGY